MKQFGNLYSQYYDLLYQDKDYLGEVEYVEKLIKEHRKDSNTLLDLGCGTGKHSALFCDKGYLVHGVDLSEEMLKIAEIRRKGKEEKLNFSCGNIKELNLKNKFDVVVSLFHVMSYQNSNEDLIAAFKVAKNHTVKNGLFIFDFWYGPAVLTDLPTTRVKKLENKKIKVTRIAEPVLHPQKNTVDVNYDVFIEDKEQDITERNHELHKMRYFFDTELELICKEVGFNVEKKYAWMNDEKPGFNSWNVVWIVRRIF